MRTLRAFLALKLKLKLYPSVEKVFKVDELEINDVLVLLLPRVLWLGRWKRLLCLQLYLPEGTGRLIRSKERGREDEVGGRAGTGVGGVPVTLGLRRSMADLRTPSRELIEVFSATFIRVVACFPSLDFPGAFSGRSMRDFNFF